MNEGFVVWPRKIILFYSKNREFLSFSFYVMSILLTFIFRFIRDWVQYSDKSQKITSLRFSTIFVLLFLQKVKSISKRFLTVVLIMEGKCVQRKLYQSNIFQKQKILPHFIFFNLYTYKLNANIYDMI